jgi:hypothetical protein
LFSLLKETVSSSLEGILPRKDNFGSQTIYLKGLQHYMIKIGNNVFCNSFTFLVVGRIFMKI